MNNLHDLKYAALFLVGLILITGCAPQGEETAELAVSHKAAKYTFFTENLPEGANDLHVEFDQENVKTKDMGPFDEAKTEGKIVNLKRSVLSFRAEPTAKIEFERDGDFNIVKWWWTRHGEQFGDENTGPP